MFKIGQKCLYLFDGIWKSCEIVETGLKKRYLVRNDLGIFIVCPEPMLKPTDNLLDYPREFSETVPAKVASFAAMMIRLKHFTTTKFMEGYEHGI